MKTIDSETSDAIATVMGDLFDRFEANEETLETDVANLPPISPETEQALLAEIDADLDKHYPTLT
ncbi:hypothetical protein K2P47_01040 [Patescibacteria group bacterium]|nr:hypothetical protein [Patescibacteria group bacterium]